MTFSSTKKFFKIISRKNLLKFLFIFQPTAAEEQAIGKIDDLLESFMGIRDGDLAKTIWECGKDKVNPDQFLASLDAEVGEFGFPQDFIFDVWGVMKDTRVSS